MNRESLASFISQKQNITKASAEAAINSVFSGIQLALSETLEDIRLTNFGTFTVRKIKSHKGRNPKTGDVVEIPATIRVSFKAGKQLKESLYSKASAKTVAKKSKTEDSVSKAPAKKIIIKKK